jgi:hypothetical protein
MSFQGICISLAKVYTVLWCSPMNYSRVSPKYTPFHRSIQVCYTAICLLCKKGCTNLEMQSSELKIFRRENLVK